MGWGHAYYDILKNIDIDNEKEENDDALPLLYAADKRCRLRQAVGTFSFIAGDDIFAITH